MKKKIITASLALLSVSLLLGACSNSKEKSESKTATKTEKKVVEKKEVGLGEYLNQSDKNPQIWYAVDSVSLGGKVKELFLVQDRKTTYYNTSTETNFSSISAKDYEKDYLGRNLYSSGNIAQGLLDDFNETDTITKITTKNLTDIVKKYDTEDGNQDGVIQAPSINALTFAEVIKSSDSEIINLAKKIESAKIHYTILKAKINLEMQTLTDGSNNTHALKKLSQLEETLVNKKGDEYLLESYTDEDFEKTEYEVLHFKTYNLFYENTVYDNFMIKEDNFRLTTNQIPLDTKKVGDTNFMGFVGSASLSFVTKQPENNMELTVDTYAKKPKNVSFYQVGHSDSGNKE